MKKRVLVIGGGVAAMTAVYSLTKLPDWRNRFDITVYQMGWRLGGKGASGRNAAKGYRIEEHGLHVWAGFYQNAFRNLRACYEDMARLGLRAPDAPMATIEQAFTPLDYLCLAEDVPSPDGSQIDWRPWLIDLPDNAELPGKATTVMTPFETFCHVLATLHEFLQRHELEDSTDPTADRPRRDHVTAKLRSAHGNLHSFVQRLPKHPKHHLPSHQSLLTDFITAAQSELHTLQTAEAQQDDRLRRLLLLMDVMLAYAHGMAASDAFTTGYDVLDQWEFTDWLRANGASEQVLTSVLLRGCYDFVFGFPSGNVRVPNMGAGTAVRAMGRLLLTYSQTVFHQMEAGMGDTVFAPYYLVLHRLGVKFEFFHAATALRLTPDGTEVSAVEMVRQARTVDDAPYRPLHDVKGLPCWLSTPDWDQLVDGRRMEHEGVNFESEEHAPHGELLVKRKGQDFDIVLLGASHGSLHRLTGDLRAASPRWARMLDHVKTVGTAAAQFWLDNPPERMGWMKQLHRHNNAAALPTTSLRSMVTGFAEALDTWADMTHLLPAEGWPDADPPKSIAYFCSPAADGESLVDYKRRVQAWVDNQLPHLWPAAGRLHYHGGGFDDQYFRVNMHGSERYVLSVAGSLYHRLAPDESGFYNLVLAGDWTRCGLNAGCVEAATMSGIAAASAISGEKLLNLGADDIPAEDTVEEAARLTTLSVTGAPWPLTGNFARGEMTGWFVHFALPRAQVKALLPPGVHLGTSNLVPPGMHPVGMSFCRYHDVRGSFLPDFLAMPGYNEMAFAIPDTRTDAGGQAPFLYPHRLFVDNQAAILAGKLFYAMNKSRAQMTMTESTFTGNNGGSLRVHADFVQQDDPVALVNHPAIGAVSALLGTAFVTNSPGNRLLYNAFDMHLDKAWVAPVHGRVSVSDQTTHGIPTTNLNVDPLAPGLPSGLPGAMRIWCSWSMSNPLDGTRIRRAAKAWTFLERTA